MQPDSTPQDAPPEDGSSYEPPVISDISDGVTPLATAPTAALPS